jgi:hypothetical protein
MKRPFNDRLSRIFPVNLENFHFENDQETALAGARREGVREIYLLC